MTISATLQTKVNGQVYTNASEIESEDKRGNLILSYWKQHCFQVRVVSLFKSVIDFGSWSIFDSTRVEWARRLWSASFFLFCFFASRMFVWFISLIPNIWHCRRWSVLLWTASSRVEFRQERKWKGSCSEGWCSWCQEVIPRDDQYRKLPVFGQSQSSNVAFQKLWQWNG